MLFERLFRQVYLPTLDVEVGQVPDHAATSHPQHLSSLLHPAMTRPLYILIIGQQLATQHDPRLLPESERLLRQFEDLAVAALLKELLTIGRAHHLAQDFARRTQRFPCFLLVGLRPQDACHASSNSPKRDTRSSGRGLSWPFPTTCSTPCVSLLIGSFTVLPLRE